MIYYFDEMEKVTPKELQLWEGMIPNKRREYANTYRFYEDKCSCILTYILLWVALFLETGDKKPPQLIRDRNGKPFLTDTKKQWISLSHCKKAVACAISDKNIGIDIQEYVEYNEDIAELFMTDAERNCSKNKGHLFTQIWALKESLGKYMGCGICYDMQKTSVICRDRKEARISDRRLFERFVVAYTAEEKMDIIKLSYESLIQAIREL